MIGRVGIEGKQTLGKTNLPFFFTSLPVGFDEALAPRRTTDVAPRLCSRRPRLLAAWALRRAGRNGSPSGSVNAVSEGRMHRQPARVAVDAVSAVDIARLAHVASGALRSAFKADWKARLRVGQPRLVLRGRRGRLVGDDLAHGTHEGPSEVCNDIAPRGGMARRGPRTASLLDSAARCSRSSVSSLA